MNTPHRNRRPPRFLAYILRHMSLYDAHHAQEGDFEETFRRISQSKGVQAARFWYMKEVLRSIPEYLKIATYTGIGLLFNYIKLTLRGLKKHRIYAVINICGLAIGLAAVILIFLYVRFETSFDRYHPDSDRIFRIVDQEFTAIPFILGNQMQDQSPEIEDMLRLKEVTHWGALVVKADGVFHLERKILMAEPSLFRLLTYRFLYGSPESAFSSPQALVLTESTARRYFGQSEPSGQTVVIKGIPFQVTAVIEDIPANTHIHFNAAVPAAAESSLDPRSDDQTSWTSSNYKTYVKIAPLADLHSIESRVNVLYSQGREEHSELHLQPLTDIHLYSHLRSEYEANGASEMCGSTQPSV